METNQSQPTTCGASSAPGCSKSEFDTPRTLIQVKEADGYRTETEAMAHMVDFCKQLELETRELRLCLTEAMEWCKPCNYTSVTWRRWAAARDAVPTLNPRVDGAADEQTKEEQGT